MFCLVFARRSLIFSQELAKQSSKNKFSRATLMPVAALFFLTACSDGVQLSQSSTAVLDDSASGPSLVQPEQPESPSTVTQRLAVHNDGFEGDFYSGSGQCSQCHNGMTDSRGNDVSIVSDWSTSMMANAARDPYWIAKVAVEMARNPQLTDELNDTCSRCHTPMANDTARKNNLPLAILDDDGFLNEQNALFDHAMEGVSCTLCHQVEDDGLLGTVEGVSGNYSVAVQARRSDRPAYGPYVDPVGIRMQTQAQFNPLFGSHIATSESCAACHDLRTPEFSNENGLAAASFFPEQMVYSEWKNSVFAQAGADGRNCQSCHMPTVPGTVPLAVDGGGGPREDFSQHSFLGPNTVMQSVLMNNADDLGITVPRAAFETSIARNREFVKTSASVQILSSEQRGTELVTRVRVQNLAGHKLPSGFASRRAVVHFTVTDSTGETVFESGAENSDGSIVGLASDTDSTQYELHYDEVTSADQVQVYEAIMGDEASQVTHTLMNASQYLKDNRLLPAGFDKTSAADDIATRGLASADASFDAGGDEIVYRVPVSGADTLTVDVSLVYQPLAFGHLQDLFLNADLPSVGYFQSLFQSADLKSEVIASDVVQINAN